MFSVKREVLEKLVNSPEWKNKLNRAKTFPEIEQVIIDFCREQGYKIARVKVKQD